MKRWVAVLVLTMTVACSSSTSSRAPSLVTDALNAFDHAVTVPQHLVRTSGNGPLLGAVIEASGLRRLRDFDNPCGGGIGSHSVYAVTGDANALWSRLREVGDEVWTAQARFDGRRVRLLHESGFDYSITVTMLDPSDDSPALVVVLSCS